MTAPDAPPMATPRVAAGALFFDADGRILFVHPTYKDYWDIPGGYVEPGESPLQACRREIREELGISPPIGRLLVVDWAPADDEGDKLLFIFDGGTLSHENVPASSGSEIGGHAFKTIEEAEQQIPARLARRIRTAIKAKSTNASVYAEHGDALNGARSSE